MIVQPVVEPMDRFTALVFNYCSYSRWSPARTCSIRCPQKLFSWCSNGFPSAPWPSQPEVSLLRLSRTCSWEYGNFSAKKLIKYFPFILILYSFSLSVCKRWLRLSQDESLWRRLDLGLATVPAGVVGQVSTVRHSTV